MKKFLLLALSLACSTSALGLPLHRLVEAKRDGHHSLAGLPVIKSAIHTQKLDHTTTDLRTFKQRYWATTHYAKGGSSAPVILYLCGEGACNANAALTPASFASTLGANVVALEHRFYGKSQPFADLSTANLQHLSSDQAVSDIVDLKVSLSNSLGWRGPWIVIGGSYAGALAAYARILHPNHFSAALASSAPVVPTPDLSAYDEYLASKVSSSCTADIQRTLGEIESRITTPEGLKEILSKFSVKSYVTRGDDFLSLLGDIASAAIQLGRKDEFCMQVATRGVDGFADIKREIDKGYGDFAQYSAEAAQNSSLAPHEGALGMRQWYYQSCTEYGLWQNASSRAGQSVRSKLVNASYHDGLCKRLFGLTTSTGGVRIDALFTQVMASASKAIFYTSGEDDPWMPTNVSPFTGHLPPPGSEAYGIKGASHCEDLSRSNNPDTALAKKRFNVLAAEWIKP